MRDLQGKTALITGASRGIGLAIARRLVDEGARVCVTARKAETLEAAVEALGGPEHAIAVAGRADDPDHQAQAVAAAVEAFGSLDILVNNAGINPAYGRMIDLDPAAFRKTFEVNVISALAWVREAHKAWLGEHGGAVVNVASVAGLGAAPGIGGYAASKAALIQLTVQLAEELSPLIRVNAVAPAIVKTDFASVLFEGREDKVAQGYALGRLGVPDDIAGAVAFLASADAGWITGQTLVLDGGVTLKSGV
ncbi:MAG TPA: SDR family oxidoreductase [Actinospica sp.]|nr:SDR family oxidoreductase [Actinospica sp.]